MLALACLLVALVIVLALVLRGSGDARTAGPGAASSSAGALDRAPPRPTRPEDAPRPETYPDTETLQGTTRLEASQPLCPAADPASPVIIDAPAGATVELRGGRPGWTLIGWSAAPGQVWVGWIQLEPSSARAGAVRGRVTGAIRFEGAPPPPPEEPKSRAAAPFCKGKKVPLEDLVVRKGLVQDVLVQLKGVGLRGAAAPPRERAVVHQIDCMYRPPVIGVVMGEDLQIDNDDPTLHNVHTYRGAETVYNEAQPKGGEPIVHRMEEPGILELRCDIHPWMRAHVVVTEHPFFAVTGEDGRFAIEGAPAGRYVLEAWHPRLGTQKKAVTVVEAGAEVEFAYRPEDYHPAEDAADEGAIVE